MNTDLSVAPEIAQLAAPPGHSRASSAPATPGRAGSELARLAAAPQRWWDLVRFDPDTAARIPVPGASGAWLLVLPPGASADCDCGYATLLAGEAAESGDPAAPLRTGRVRVHGRRADPVAGTAQPVHQVRGAGHGYSVSLHAPVVPPGE